MALTGCSNETEESTTDGASADVIYVNGSIPAKEESATGRTRVPYPARFRQQADFAIAALCRVLQISAGGSTAAGETESTPAPVSMRV